MEHNNYLSNREQLLSNDCSYILDLEYITTQTLIKNLLLIANDIKSDFDRAIPLMPFWGNYAPMQRGHKPRGEAYPWGEVGEKVIEGHIYSIVHNIFHQVKFTGIPYGHDIRFSTNNAFIHIDAKSTGPTDNKNEIVSSPNQVTGNGLFNCHNGMVYNSPVEMKGKIASHSFLPELAPFIVDDNIIKPVLTYYIKLVYSVKSLGNQPLDYLELICVPNGLALFDGPMLINKINGLLTPGKDEKHVIRKRTRIQLKPLSIYNPWRCTKIMFDHNAPYLTTRV